jgi:hypothetical protein
MIVLGIAAFMYNPAERAHQVRSISRRSLLSIHSMQQRNDETPNYFWGYLLLFGSLVMDGVTGPYQQLLFRTAAVSRNRMMWYANLFAALYMLIVIVVSGELDKITTFFSKYPAVLWDVFVSSALSAIGQLFIYYTLQVRSLLIAR